MTSNQSNCRAGAFSLVELLCVMAIIAILAALILPALDQGKSRVKRIECENNLHQQGIAFQMFMHDHNDKFPMAVPIDAGGSKEFVQNGYAMGGEFYFSYRHFQVLSNELSSPAILICPADTRLPATNFAALLNSNVSYFVGVQADPARPDSILAGDRNITANSYSNPSLLHGDADNRLSWTWELHRYKGNVLFADGRVEEWNNAALAAGIGAQLSGADMAMPSVPPAAIYPVSSQTGNSRYPAPSFSGETPPITSAADHPENTPSAVPAASSQSRPLQPIVVSAGPQHPPAPPAPVATHPPPPKALSTNASAGSTTPTEETEPAMPGVDLRLVKILRRIIIGFYLLILLVLLLWFLLARWRKSQRKKMQGKDGF